MHSLLIGCALGPILSNYLKQYSAIGRHQIYMMNRRDHFLKHIRIFYFSSKTINSISLVRLF